MPSTLTHLAQVIDLTEERLEDAEVPFVRNQLREALERLRKRFEAEYEKYMASTGQTHPADLLSRAA